MADHIRSALFSVDPGARIEALTELLTTEKAEWAEATDYLEQTLRPDTHAPEGELRLAVEVALRSPVEPLRSLVKQLATVGSADERAEAVMGLVRHREATSKHLIEVLGFEDLDESREFVAEHFLLLDVSPVMAEVAAQLRREGDPGVRFWLAGALANAGDDAALRDEIHTGRIPDSLRSLLRFTDTDTARCTVEPRLELLAEPALVWEERPREPLAGGAMAEAAKEPGPGAGPPEETEPPSYAEERAPTGAGWAAELPDGDESPVVEVREGNGGAPPVAAAPSQPRRYFVGRAPDRVELGTTVGVQLRIAVDRREGESAEPINIEVPPQGLDVTITCHTPGFELDGDQQMQQLHVPAAGDSDWILSRLRSTRQGVFDLIFTAFHPEGRMIGELQLQISVDSQAVTTQSREVRSGVPSLRGGDGDISLTVDWLDVENVYRFQLIDRSLPDEVLTDHLLRSPRDIVENLVGQLAAMARGEMGRGQNLRAMLRDRGVQLWNELIPDALKSQFWDRQPRIKTLRILARKDPIPWEILYPLSAGNDAGFLVEQFPVLRSVRGLEPIDRLGSGTVETVVPAQNAPTSAANEAEMVRRIWAGRSCGKEITDLASLRTVLDGASFGLLHLACHNTFDPSDPDHINIRFGDGSFDPPVLAPLIAKQALAKASPLVFVNACRSAGEAPLYTELSGWAGAFMEAGAAAFVGSLWAVRDSSARRFAETFYDSIKGGSPIGAAVSQARGAVTADDDPTWLAYTAYGDPAATI